MKVIIIHPGEPSYLFGLVSGLSKIKDLNLIVIGAEKSLDLLNKFSNVDFKNFRGNQRTDVSLLDKSIRNLKYYYKTNTFILMSDAKLIHIQWFNKFVLLEVFFLNIVYKLFGKKIIYTAHNVNQGKRDETRNIFSDFSLKFLYTIVDHIIVHNNYSKQELIREFKIRQDKISVNKLGLNIQVPKTGLTKEKARKFFSLSNDDKVILFFGGLDSYKGVDILINAFQKICLSSHEYKLIIAGAARDKKYTRELEDLINHYKLNQNIILKTRFIPDDDVENYFVAADCLVLPYRSIYQSGLHVLSYSFGLPIIATNVGSFKKEDIIEGFNGFISEKIDPDSIEMTIMRYFTSDIYKYLEKNKVDIINWAKEVYSWDTIGMNTYFLYKDLLK